MHLNFFYPVKNEADTKLGDMLGEFYNRPGVNTRLENIARTLYPNENKSKVASSLPNLFLILKIFTDITPETMRESNSLLNTTYAITELCDYFNKQPDISKKIGLDPSNHKYINIQLKKLIGDMKQLIDKSDDCLLKDLVHKRIVEVWQSTNIKGR